jgi:hypothetical protein
LVNRGSGALQNNFCAKRRRIRKNDLRRRIGSRDQPLVTATKPNVPNSPDETMKPTASPAADA